MTSDPIVLFPMQVTWTAVDASISFTLSSKTSRGGYGIEGYGRIYKAAYIMGAADGGTGGGNSGFTG